MRIEKGIRMKRENFTVEEHGFCGHLAEPDEGASKAVIVIMGGEKGLLPGRMIAERFADYGFIGLAVSLFGAEGLPDSPDQVPLELLEHAVEYLKEVKKVSSVSTYGQSMGSIFAVLTACYVGGMDNVILVAPTHVPFEGTRANRKTMTGYSVATWRGMDVPFVKADFSRVKPSKYLSHPAASHKVTGMWTAFYDAYQDAQAVQKARLPIEKTGARILLIAGAADEMWPAEISACFLEAELKQAGYERDYKVIVHPKVSHLTGMMPNRQRERRLYRMIPLVGLMYRSFGKYKKENLIALERSEKEIIDWLNAK